MNTGTRLVVGFGVTLSIVFLLFGLLWWMNMRSVAGLLLMVGGVGVLLRFGYAGYRWLTTQVRDDS